MKYITILVSAILISTAIGLNALTNRYSVYHRGTEFIKTDKWTGTVSIYNFKWDRWFVLPKESAHYEELKAKGQESVKHGIDFSKFEKEKIVI